MLYITFRRAEGGFKDISTIYVAQNDRNIILKGRISDRTLLDKLVKVAQNIEGVNKVDVSLVEIL